VLPATDGAGARALAAQISEALQAGAETPAAAGGVLAGIAVCPWNARLPAALAAHADVDLYAARGPLAARA
jgi:predicted signal transduction protein with EAL and GGDEF domain